MQFLWKVFESQFDVVIFIVSCYIPPHHLITCLSLSLNQILNHLQILKCYVKCIANELLSNQWYQFSSSSFNISWDYIQRKWIWRLFLSSSVLPPGSSEVRCSVTQGWNTIKMIIVQGESEIMSQIKNEEKKWDS